MNESRSPLDQELQVGLVSQLNSFLSFWDQWKIGYAATVQNAVDKIMAELHNRMLLIRSQQQELEQRRAQGKELEKEIEALKAPKESLQ